MAESAGLQLLQVFGRNQILILSVFANKSGDIGTEWDDAQVIGAGKIEGHSGKFCRQALAFQRLRHFGVVKNDAIGKAPIRQQRMLAIDEQFETPGLLVVDDGYVVEIRVHESPSGIADLFLDFVIERLRLTGKVYQGILQN
jgi:hypothetical protein